MTLEEAKEWMGSRYVLHPAYRANPCAWHATIARWPGYDIRATFERVRARQRPPSAIAEAERQRLRLVFGKVRA